SRFLNSPTPLGGRVRLLVAMFLLALPLAGGIWAFAAFAGRSGQERAEAELGAAASRATAVAARRDVQLALLRRDRVRLARIAKTLPGIAFVPRQGPAIGAARGPGSRHPVEVFVGKQRVGRVVASVAFDAALLRRLSRRSELPSGDRLVFRRDLPTEVTIQGTRYHAAAARLQGGKD